MNTHNIRCLHEELKEDENLYLLFNSNSSHNILIISPTDKLTFEKGDLVVENDEYKQIIAPDTIFRACKRRG